MMGCVKRFAPFIAFALAVASAARADYSHQSVLTVAGYSGTTELTNFPVLVRISPDRIKGFSYDDFLVREGGVPTGADMRFVSTNGTSVYAHEIDTWDPTGESCVWVKVPRLSGTDTEILFQYGDATATAAADGTLVWKGDGSTDPHYAGVWHFGEEIDAAAAPTAVSADSARADGTSSLDAKLWSSTAANAAQAVSVTGRIGRARRVQSVAPSGNSCNSFRVPDCDTLHLGSSFTVSAWLRTDLVQSSYAGYRFLSRKSYWEDEAGWEFNFESNGLSDILARGSHRTYAMASGTPRPVTNWIHVAAHYNGSTARVYVNGVMLAENTAIDPVVDSSVDLSIGSTSGSNSSNAFPGSMDEVRLYAASASDDWINAEYETAADDSFVAAETAMPVRNALFVESDVETGTVSPAWGSNTGFAEGETVTCTATDDPFAVNPDLLVAYSGWTLYNLDGTVAASGAGTTCSFTYHDGPSHRLVWHYSEVSDFRYRSILTVAGYAGTETLTNFPLLVRISPETVYNFNYSKLRADHADVRFTSLDGAVEYPFEVESWNTNGESVVWVRVPELSGTETQLRFEYGDAYWAHGDDRATEVWEETADGNFYAGVWHFGEEIDAAAAPTAKSADSAKRLASLDLDMKPYSSSYRAQMVSTNGIAGPARFIAETQGNGNGLVVTNYNALGLESRFTASLWLRSWNEISGNHSANRFLSHKSGWGNADGWEFNYESSRRMTTVLIRGSSGGNVMQSGLFSPLDGWEHAVAVYDGPTARLYVNGELIQEGSIASVTNNELNLFVGSAYNGGNTFPGALDEFRLWSGAASADRVKADYDTVASPSFLRAGTAMPLANALVVEPETEAYGDVVPTWGEHTDFNDGDTIVCTAAREPIVAGPDMKLAVAGWTLYNFDGTVADSGDGSMCSYVYHDGPSKRLVWRYAEVPDFSYRATLTVSGYSGAETLSDFPVLVRLSPSTVRNFDYSVLRDDHADIRFTSPDGAVEYPHEVDTWNTNGESLVWVRLPSLSGTATQFRLEYGDACWAHGGSSETWNGSADPSTFFAGVWHLNETVDAAGATKTNAADSAKHLSSLVMDMTPQYNNYGSEMVSTNGAIGLGRVNCLAENRENGLLIPSYDEFALEGRFTASVWLNSAVETFGSVRIFERKDSWGDANGFEIAFNGSQNEIIARGAAGSPYPQATPLPDFFGNWVLVTVAFDGDNAYVYANGERAGTGSTTVAPTDNGKALMVAAQRNRGYSFPGLVDEVRLWSGVASADRVKADYDTATVRDFVTAGAARPTSDALVVESSSGEYGTVTPAYGFHTEYEDGEVVACSAPTETIVVSETLRVVCEGWTLYQEETNGTSTVLDSAKTNRYDYVHRHGPARRLVWNFVEAPALRLSSDIGCRFEVNGQVVDGGTNYVSKGETTLRAIAPVGYEFLRWEGDVDAHRDVFAVQTFDFEATRSLKAVFLEVDAQHEARTAVWSGADGGSWHDAANWGGTLPGPDDTVSLSGCGSVVVTAAVPHLASLTVGSGARIVVSNWYSRLSADAITVASCGTVGCFGAFMNGAPSNRVWLAGGTLAVAAGGTVTADGAGYAGTNGPCWKAETYAAAYDSGSPFALAGGAYGGGQGFVRGWNIGGTYPLVTNPEVPQPYGDAEYPFDPGSGAGPLARSGGGAILLDFTGAVTVNGTVTADAYWADAALADKSQGEGGYNHLSPGFGSGGGICIRCLTIAGSGSVSADAGYYTGSRRGGGGGSGGRIAVHYDTTAEDGLECAIRFSARGGSASDVESVHDVGGFGECGTIWLPDNAILKAGVPPDLLSGRVTGPAAEEALELEYDGNLDLVSSAFSHPGVRSFSVAGNLTLDTDDDPSLPGISGVSPTVFSNCTVSVGGSVTIRGSRLQLAGGTLSVGGNLTLANLRNAFVGGGGELLVQAAPTNAGESCGALVTVAGLTTVERNGAIWPEASRTDGASVLFRTRHLTVCEGGRVSSDQLGWDCGTGPGAAPYNASYGGKGSGAAKDSGVCYGLAEYPIDPGSGNRYFRGGGCVRLEVERTATIDGVVSANANTLSGTRTCSGYTCGSSGGGVYLKANRVVGGGSVNALGGGGEDFSAYASGNYGCGGGGRIAIYTRHEVSDDFKASVTSGVGRCASESDAGVGTVYYGSLPIRGFAVFVR